jgi:WD40 repeat protein
VLVFDQFEELFSRSGGNVELVKQVFGGLANLIENRIPAEFATEEAASARSRLDFLSQHYRVILSFREDFLPEIRAWEKQVPSLLRNYLRLEPMSRDRAIDAVQRAGKEVLEKGVAASIVDFVGTLDRAGGDADTSDVTVEPVLLSLCCYQLNRRRVDGRKIDAVLVRTAGQNILESFYREALDDPQVKGPPDVALFIEDYLIQADRFRGDYPRNEAIDEQKLTRGQLAALTDRHRLLRIVAHTDTARIELIHDRLVPVVRKARDERRAREQQLEQQRLAEEAQAERDRERARSEELERQRDIANHSLVIARRRRNWAMAALLVCSLALVWGGLAWWDRDRMQRSTAVAVSTSRLAQGTLALGVGREPLEQQMYRALAAYRLTDQRRTSQARAESLTALHYTLENSGHLRKAVTIEGFQPTTALAYSPDGKMLAVGGEDGLVRLLDAETFHEQARFGSDCNRAAEVLWTFAFNADGTRLVAGYSGHGVNGTGSGLVCVFDVPRRRMLARWSAKELWSSPADIYSVAYGGAPGSEFVVSGGSDGKLRLLELKTGAMRQVAVDGVAAVAVSPDGNSVAAGGSDKVVRLVKVAHFGDPTAPPVELEGHAATIQQVAFLPWNSSILISAGDDGRIMVWNVDERCLAQQSKEQRWRLYGFAISAADRELPMIAAASGDGNVRLFRLNENQSTCRTKQKDPKTGKTSVPTFDVILDGELMGHGGIVLATAFNPTGDRLASTGQEGSIRIWGPKTGGFSLAELAREVQGTQPIVSPGAVTSVAISPDGEWVAAGDDRGNILVWEPPDLRAEPVTQLAAATWKAHAKAVRSLAFIPVGDRVRLASGGDDGVIRRWDTATRKQIGADLADDASAVRSIAVSPDRKWLAAGSADGTVRIWDATSGERVRRFEKPKDSDENYELKAVGYTVDGKHIAVGSSYVGLRVLALDGPDSERVLLGHSLGVTSISRGKDAWLLSVGPDGSVLEWQRSALAVAQADGIGKRDEFKFRMGYRDLEPLTAIDTSADGSLILTGGNDGQVQLWDGIEHVLIGRRFAGHSRKGAIQAVAMAPDGRFFVTADAQTILLWPGPKIWADIVCAKLVYNMSAEQWREWLPGVDYVDQCPKLPKASDHNARNSR